MGSELRGRYRRQLTAAMAPRSYTKTYKVPRRPFESARLDSELKVVGEYGLRNKREVWRVQLTLSKIRRAARQLLTLDEKDPKRLFEGNALIRRLVRVGVLDESRMKLDYVLALKVEDFLERRLQTCSRQVDPPRPCPDPSASHPRRQADRQRSFLHCPSGQPEAHRLRPHLSIRWWPPRPCPEKEGQGC